MNDLVFFLNNDEYTLELIKSQCNKQPLTSHTRLLELA